MRLVYLGWRTTYYVFTYFIDKTLRHLDTHLWENKSLFTSIIHSFWFISWKQSIFRTYFSIPDNWPWLVIQINNIWAFIILELEQICAGKIFWQPNNIHSSMWVFIIGIGWHNITGMQKNRSVWSCKQQGTPNRGSRLQRTWLISNTEEDMISARLYVSIRLHLYWSAAA